MPCVCTTSETYLNLFNRGIKKRQIQTHIEKLAWDGLDYDGESSAFQNLSILLYTDQQGGRVIAELHKEAGLYYIQRNKRACYFILKSMELDLANLSRNSSVVVQS